MKRLTAVILAVMCMVGTICSVSAAEAQVDTSNENIMEDFLTPFFEGDRESYSIYDVGGNDIVNMFYEKTYGLYKAGDWDGIKQVYKAMNVDGISRTRVIETPAVLTRASDLSKTVLDGHYELMEDHGGSGRNIEVGTELRGTFHYDANTYVITGVSKPVLTYCAISYASPDVSHTDPILNGTKSGSYGAKFTCKFDVTDVIIYEGVPMIIYKYGTYEHSFTAKSTD